MTAGHDRRDGRLELSAVGAAACVACCAGPLLSLLGALTVAGLVSSLELGGIGLGVAALSALAWVLVRRRRSARASGAAGPVRSSSPASAGSSI
jgi:hypothetical protein